MTPIFLDTVGLLALWNSDDQWHDSARIAYEKIIFAREPIVTTTFVLLECGNSASRRTFREDVCELRKTLELREELIVPSHDDWNTAWDAYRQGKAGAAGIVDYVSFAVMRRLGIDRAFTNDRHFREAGFETLF
jgi:predicted nucleic acid-binding protein